MQVTSTRTGIVEWLASLRMTPLEWWYVIVITVCGANTEAQV
jgi:hypothetical protein